MHKLSENLGLIERKKQDKRKEALRKGISLDHLQNTYQKLNNKKFDGLRTVDEKNILWKAFRQKKCREIFDSYMQETLEDSSSSFS